MISEITMQLNLWYYLSWMVKKWYRSTICTLCSISVHILYNVPTCVPTVYYCTCTCRPRSVYVLYTCILYMQYTVYCTVCLCTVYFVKTYMYMYSILNKLNNTCSLYRKTIENRSYLLGTRRSTITSHIFLIFLLVHLLGNTPSPTYYSRGS